MINRRAWLLEAIAALLAASITTPAIAGSQIEVGPSPTPTTEVALTASATAAPNFSYHENGWDITWDEDWTVYTDPDTSANLSILPPGTISHPDYSTEMYYPCDLVLVNDTFRACWTHGGTGYSQPDEFADATAYVRHYAYEFVGSNRDHPLNAPDGTPLYQEGDSYSWGLFAIRDWSQPYADEPKPLRSLYIAAFYADNQTDGLVMIVVGPSPDSFNESADQLQYLIDHTNVESPFQKPSN